MTDIAMHGVLSVGPYKGYCGRAEYDAETGEFHGSVTALKDAITFVGGSPSEVTAAFKDSVDDYLAFCKERGETPDRPFSGHFIIRSTPKLHRDLYLIATQQGKSLNQYVISILESTFSAPSTSVPVVIQGYPSYPAASPTMQFVSPGKALQNFVLDSPQTTWVDYTGALLSPSTTPSQSHAVSLPKGEEVYGMLPRVKPRRMVS